MYRERLRDLIDRDELLQCPGVHDPLTAAVADDVGFDAIYMTGYGTSLSKTGYPDAGLLTMPEMVENAKNIQERSSVPVIADADNGYGNATNVVRTVREYVKAGVAGIHIEDQTFPKRCGHTKGRKVIPKAEAVGKIRAAADVRDERDESFVLIARTDARGAVGGDLNDAIERANAYVDAGADVAFVEGPVDEDEIARIGREVDAPLVYNCVGELGTSPYVEPDALTELGFDLVLYPVASTLATIAAVYERLSGLKSEGMDALADIDRAFAETPVGDLHEFSGFPEVVEWERRYMPSEEQEKYGDSLGDDVE
ncbi:carboxyvinyl-carboxyphosphonate phosphorylmutase [Haladaptatus sp. W1]|uniref:isocitrate lyase/PEP mutase family protein n=1 Tax=Haladaptatus sp. W1 TaxID=1897478 RepID=UPI000849C0BC|nr:isocitrate lyase/PEP mutase family protein [Haladaptatus sp. W1]ODR83492.1 carboxyvinyl-carboxyphosphonate phosphorylmutase [Haladaptatus sp. W1]